MREAKSKSEEATVGGEREERGELVWVGSKVLYRRFVNCIGMGGWGG